MNNIIEIKSNHCTTKSLEIAKEFLDKSENVVYVFDKGKISKAQYLKEKILNSFDNIKKQRQSSNRIEFNNKAKLYIVDVKDTTTITGITTKILIFDNVEIIPILAEGTKTFKEHKIYHICKKEENK
jgi:hypothetical protein